MAKTEYGRTSLGEGLRSRVMAAYALCAIAESEVQEQELERALKTVKATRRLLSEVNVLIGDPCEQISLSTINDAGDMLAELELRNSGN